MTSPTADVQVRVAWSDDAPALAALQVRTWRALWSELVPPERLPDSPGQVEPAWRDALRAPGDARRRVLVAIEGDEVTGFVLTGPATDPDCDPVAVGELVDLTVDPERTGRGHGSRLLQAAVDTLVADRFARAVTWVTAQDDATRAFLTAAGWAADGAHRELALEEDASAGVRQVRLHTTWQ